jgi:hypothetical protein
MAAGVVREAAAHSSARSQAAILATIATIFGLSYLRGSVQGDAFALKALFDDRYRVAAATAAARTPSQSAIICLLQSGSIRYYADRLTVRYDLIDPEWLDWSAREARHCCRVAYARSIQKGWSRCSDHSSPRRLGSPKFPK